MFHLNVRVAWHDNRWNGTVCKAPTENSFCLDLDRIRQERDDDHEVSIAGKSFCDLSPGDLPPCKAESAAFMCAKEWWREVKHPYQENKKTQLTHGHLRPTKIRIPPYSTFAVPFNWMLIENQSRIDDMLAEPLPVDSKAPFPSPWVFGNERQEALSDLFFNRLSPKSSLVFFYTKSGHPLNEKISRLVVGVGVIKKLHKIIRYESVGDKSYPLWDRLFEHSIRNDGVEGFLLPYHEYLAKTGSIEEDARRLEFLDEITVSPERSQVMAFSYAGEHATSDIVLSTLTQCLAAVRKIREHGIANGPWDKREDWLNKQIAKCWKDRGAFPGTGSVLEALGMRLGTSLVLELFSSGKLNSNDDPWPILDKIFKGVQQPPQAVYTDDVQAVSATWISLNDERRSLIKLLSRFSLSAKQALRWFDVKERNKATRSVVSDFDILKNPYRIAETDLGDAKEHPVSIGVIDRGLFPDSIIDAAHPIPEPSNIGSKLDWRRSRAALVIVLRRAADNGDSLLTDAEALMELSKLDLEHPCVLTKDWLIGNKDALSDEVIQFSTLVEPENGIYSDCLQLTDLNKRESKLANILSKRATKHIPSLNENWEALLTEAIEESGAIIDKTNTRHSGALKEQAEALEFITTKRLSALVGRAGTGKTTVLGAFLRAEQLLKGGVLFLAPTGKARVRLSQKANANAMTVAQFLYHLHRFDGVRQRPKFEGKEQYKKEKTVVIDECSMLTMDDLFAVLMALDLGHVQRLVLVGDPNQLPPIGVGRPFADLVAHLELSTTNGEKAGSALARLTVEVRTTAGAPSDALRLASWYTREPQPVDSDRVLSDLETGENFNDLSIQFWEKPEELQKCIEKEFVNTLGLKSADDVEGFNKAIGLTAEGWVPYEDHQGAEKFQILTPVRMHAFGIYELNRWIQKKYRSARLKTARQPWGLSLGDEEIVWSDKVILVRNGKREGYDFKLNKSIEDYLANGEIGIASKAKNPKYLNVAFVNREDKKYGFSRKNFSHDGAPLELAYALTVHKAQGSEFDKVFVVLPKGTRLMTRELLYTALTRSRDQLVLFVEGKDASGLYELTQPKLSETARRNTNLFSAGIRRNLDDGEVAYADHLVHKTIRGEMVRSKSELVIANYLYNNGLELYKYERKLEGDVAPGILRPDFSFIDDAGDVIIWEHLGMMDRDDYKKGWEWKQEWYEKNGFIQGENLFSTQEVGGFNMEEIENIAKKVKAIID